MNVNIAFNTIIYIMVFLFPGILFRRAFFSGRFNKHFNSGDTSERLLWNLLFSFLCLFVFFGIYYELHKAKITTSNVTYHDITSVFISLYDNKFPTLLQDYFKLKSTFMVLVSLYAFSILSGYVIHKIIIALGLEKRYTFFKFQENWIYLTNSNKHNNNNHTLGDIFYTRIDVKSTANELFTGELLEIVSNKDGGIDVITIKETYKFYTLKKEEANKEKINEIRVLASSQDPHILFHSETSSSYCYKKRIKGNIFSIAGNKIENISITFVKISGLIERFQRFLTTTLAIILILIFVLLVANAIWNFNIISFQSTYHRVAFSGVTFLFVFFLFGFLVNLFSFKVLKSDKEKYKKDLKLSLFILLVHIFPYLLIFGYIGWVFWLVLTFGYFFIGGYLLNENRK